MNIEVVSPEKGVFSQQSLGHLYQMNQLKDEQNPQQLQDER